MAIEFLSPVADTARPVGTSPGDRSSFPGKGAVRGRSVAFIDNSKGNASFLLSHLAAQLERELEILPRFYRKRLASEGLGAEELDEVGEECVFAVTGMGD